MTQRNRFLWLISFLLIVILNAGCAATEANTDTQENSDKKQFAALEEFFHLGEIVKIYVPSTMNVDEPIDNTPYVNKTLEELSALFGGATAIEGSGAW